MSNRLLRHTFPLLHADYVKLNKNWNYPNVISPYFRVYYIDEGEGFVVNGNKQTLLEEGFLYMIPSFTLCHLHCREYLSQYFIHFFEESAGNASLFEHNRKVIKIRAEQTDHHHMQRLLKINPGRGINRSDNPKVYEKKVFYNDYQELNETVSDSVHLETQGILLQLLSRFMNSEEYTRSNTVPPPSKILEAISYIHLNLQQRLTVDLIAKRANLHRDYFSRLFLQHTGERPMNYIHMKRIERAQYLMAVTRLSYNAIAEETGFESVPYFYRIFKKITHMTPMEYRSKNDPIFTPQ